MYRIKTLHWTGTDSTTFTHSKVSTAFGTYDITYQLGGRFFAVFDDGYETKELGKFSTMQEAQNTCQENFAGKMMMGLEPDSTALSS